MFKLMFDLFIVIIFEEEICVLFIEEFLKVMKRVKGKRVIINEFNFLLT